MLLREARDPFATTVFVAPEGLAAGRADVSVLVQWRTTGQVVLDADVSLAVEPPKGLPLARSEPFCGLSPPPAAALQSSGLSHGQALAPATPQQASNKLLYAATLNLNAVGDWRLHVDVARGSARARFDCLLPITGTSAKSSGLWPCLVFPPLLIAAFAINQWLRRHSLEAA